jgi:hypothetical protein
VGLHIQMCRFSGNDCLVGSRDYIPTCLPVARNEDGGSLPLCFSAVYFVRFEYLYLDLRCNLDTMQ